MVLPASNIVFVIQTIGSKRKEIAVTVRRSPTAAVICCEDALRAVFDEASDLGGLALVIECVYPEPSPCPPSVMETPSAATCRSSSSIMAGSAPKSASDL